MSTLHTFRKNAYSAHYFDLALKYGRKVLAQDYKDGLAFQLYLRARQTGTADDILANNCNIAVGLYRNFYGVQPKYNQLCLEPNLTTQLKGTRLNYQPRGKRCQIKLSGDDYAMAVDNFNVPSIRPFAINVERRTLEYLNGSSQNGEFAMTLSSAKRLECAVRPWPDPSVVKRSRGESCEEPGAIAENRISEFDTQRVLPACAEEQVRRFTAQRHCGLIDVQLCVRQCRPQNLTPDPDRRN